MPLEIHVLGDVWRYDDGHRSELGVLLQQAKDQGDDQAIREASSLMATWVLRECQVAEPLVVAVPASPDRPNPLVDSLARAVAEALGTSAAAGVTRRRSTAPIRTVPLGERADHVRQAEYEVVGAVAGRHVALVDDVVVSGSTLRHVGSLLDAAGAASVTGFVLARSRLR